MLTAGHDETEADEVVGALTADGTLDDRRVAAAHVRTAARVKARGRLRIARELEARGVERDLARELVREVSTEDEAAAIERLLVRKRVPATLSVIERRKLFAHLLRRGFPADAISQALRKR